MTARWLGLLFALLLAATAAAFSNTASAKAGATPYVELSDSRSAALLRQLPATHVKSAILGFVVSDGAACAPAWDGAGPVAGRPFAAQVAALGKAGVRPRLSFGGQGGRELALSCQTPQALATAYGEAARAYGITRLDFDLEGSALGRAAVARRAAALALLEGADPSLTISVTVPVSTHGIPPDALAAVRALAARGVRLAAVNVMAMDFGNSDAPNPAGRMAAYIEQSARAARRQLARIGHGLGSPARLAVTVMIGRNDTRSEVVTLADANKLAQFARAGDVGGLRYWSFNRDRRCAGPTAVARDNCSGIAQKTGQFAAVLGGARS